MLYVRICFVHGGWIVGLGLCRTTQNHGNSFDAECCHVFSRNRNGLEPCSSISRREYCTCIVIYMQNLPPGRDAYVWGRTIAVPEALLFVSSVLGHSCSYG